MTVVDKRGCRVHPRERLIIECGVECGAQFVDKEEDARGERTRRPPDGDGA